MDFGCPLQWSVPEDRGWSSPGASQCSSSKETLEPARIPGEETSHGMEGPWQLPLGSGHAQPPLPPWDRGPWDLSNTSLTCGSAGGFGFGKGFIHKATAAGKQSLSWGPCNVWVKQIRARSACGGYKQTQPGLGAGREGGKESGAERKRQRKREGRALS